MCSKIQPYAVRYSLEVIHPTDLSLNATLQANYALQVLIALAIVVASSDARLPVAGSILCRPGQVIRHLRDDGVAKVDEPALDRFEGLVVHALVARTHDIDAGRGPG